MNFMKTQIFESDNEALYFMIPGNMVECYLKDGIDAFPGAFSIYLSRKPSIIYQCVNYPDTVETLIQDAAEYELLRVEVDKTIKCKDCEGIYLELSECVSPADISLADHSLLLKDKEESLKSLCRRCFDAINDICVNIIDYYNKGKKQEELDINRMLWWIALADKLDFECYSQEAWACALKSRGGAYKPTFCDANCQYPGVVQPPLWANLLMYPGDKYCLVRTKLANLIIKTWGECLGTHTGGFVNSSKFTVDYRK